jgi:hypothetical protein
MNYVTTNIRILEEDYLRLKEEAAKKRTSFSAVIRDKLAAEKSDQNSQMTQSLLNLVEKSEKEKWTGPADLATNHDEYFIK